MIEADRRKNALIQCIILSKKRFDSINDACEWVKYQGYSTLNNFETEATYRFLQKRAELFRQNSFRTLPVTFGVSIITGLLKK